MITRDPGAPIRVLIVDDGELVRIGLRTLLGAEEDLEIVGEAGTVAAAISEAGRLQPDVVLLDLRLPDGTGFEACRGLLARAPAARVLVLTSVADSSAIEGAVQAGAHGFLLKDVHGRALVQAVRDIAIGEAVLDPAVSGRVMSLLRAPMPGQKDPLASLSPQESRIVALVAEGRTNKEAAAELGLAEKTVKNYLNNVFEKLQISRRAQVAALYVQAKGPPNR